MLPGVANRPRPRDQSIRKIETSLFHSLLLRNDRKIATYLPVGFQDGRAYDILIVLDEDVFNGPVGLPAILDDLIASRKLRPAVVAMVGNTNRELELSCNPAFAKMLAQELLPWIERQFKTRRLKTSIVGSSLGGLAAACAAFQESKTFPTVVALSASFRWRPPGNPEPEWFARQIAGSPQVKVRFSVGVGSLETDTPREPANPSLLTAARHLRDVLLAKSYRVMCREFPGAHEPLNWSLAIRDALIAAQ